MSPLSPDCSENPCLPGFASKIAAESGTMLPKMPVFSAPEINNYLKEKICGFTLIMTHAQLLV